MSKPVSPSPVAIRSRIMLEMACELVAMNDQPMRQAKVLLRTQGAAEQADWPLRLFGSSTGEGVDAVVSGESAVAIINPSGALAVACRGSATRKPAPVRTIAVIPSHDQYVFAVHPRTGLSRFEEIRERRLPLRLSLRGQRDHCLHAMLDDILRAAGFSLADLQSWGGTISYESRTPFFDEPKFGRLIRGELDAVFDEGVYEWAPQVLAAGIRILPLAEDTVRKLEAIGEQVRTRTHEITEQSEARIAELQDDIKDAGERRKAKREQRIDATRADLASRKAKLNQAADLVKDALR